MAEVSKTDKGKEKVAKPEKPDEEGFKKELEAAEKAHEAAKTRLVSRLIIALKSSLTDSCRLPRKLKLT
jgi:hypothetical protein